MAAQAYEKAVSRQIDDSENPSAQTEWIVTGATDYADARTTLDAVLPTTFTFPSSRIAYLDSIGAKELRDDEFWAFAIGYRAQPLPAPGEEEYSFDVSAPSERIFQSLATVAYNPAGKTAPNFGGAIGVADGQPQGADILAPYSTFSITKNWPRASITDAYITSVEALIGGVASSGFRSRPTGTVRFLGCRGQRSGDKFPISYEFGFRPNVAGLVIDGITVTTANGWDIIDPYYERYADVAAKKLTFRPRCVYVHQVHPLISLTALGLA